MTKKTVFITGVTGSMGGAGLNELLRRRDRFDLVTLVRPSAVNKTKLRELLKEPGLRVVWGDLTCYEDVLACVTGADIVLHPAAMIAPAADHDPQAALANACEDSVPDSFWRNFYNITVATSVPTVHHRK